MAQDDDENVHAKNSNTPFGEWWQLMHAACTAAGYMPAEYASAHLYYDGGWTPGDAARDWHGKRLGKPRKRSRKT